MQHYKMNIPSVVIILTVFGLTFLFALQHGEMSIAFFTLLLALPFGIELRRLMRESREIRMARALELCDVDNMSGIDFEHFAAELLHAQGYATEFTPATGDLGVDLVAFRNGNRCAVQCKRQSAPVSRRAVSDAVAGRSHCDCNEAMVITNGCFTQGARILAASAECKLVDRERLTQWIFDFQGKFVR